MQDILSVKKNLIAPSKINMLFELLNYGNEDAIRKLQDIDYSERFSPFSTNLFLVIDVVQPLKKIDFLGLIQKNPRIYLSKS